MHSVAGAVAETRALWCPGNIALPNEAPPPSPGRRNVAPDSGVIQRERIVTESRAYRACGFRVRLRSRLSRRGRFCARLHAAGGGLHGSGLRSYGYMVINNRLLLVDPTMGIVVAEVND
jgi:hypothetical protein